MSQDSIIGAFIDMVKRDIHTVTTADELLAIGKIIVWTLDDDLHKDTPGQ